MRMLLFPNFLLISSYQNSHWQKIGAYTGVGAYMPQSMCNEGESLHVENTTSTVLYDPGICGIHCQCGLKCPCPCAKLPLAVS